MQFSSFLHRFLYRKVISLVSLACFVLVPIVAAFTVYTVPPVQKAEAFLCPFKPPVPLSNPTSVPVHDFGLIAISVENATYTGNISSKECFLDFITKTIAKAVIHQVVSSIIDWINRGFEGGPTFVTDPGQFFKDIADEELGRMIDGSGLGFVCDPFRLQLQFAFLGQRNRYRYPPRCTITSIVQNFQGFVQGNFEDGGWEGWFELVQPQNNPYGSYFIADEILQSKINARQNVEKLKLDWGRGFKSILGKDGKIKTPGAYIESQLPAATQLELQDLGLAREFDDIVIALANYGVSQIMGNGVGGR